MKKPFKRTHKISSMGWGPDLVVVAPGLRNLISCNELGIRLA